MSLQLTSTTVLVDEDLSWIAPGGQDGYEAKHTQTLDGAACLAEFPTGIVPSGIALYKSGTKVIPFTTAVSEEIQVITVTGTPTGGTFTVTYAGQTTTAIAFNATAATVQAALIALSNIASGDVVVTGGPGPGTAWTITFGGLLRDANIAAFTTTDSFTGGSTPASAVTTSTAGGAESQTAVGLLGNTKNITTAGLDTPCAVMDQGRVLVAKLPAKHGVIASVRTDLPNIIFVD